MAPTYALVRYFPSLIGVLLFLRGHEHRYRLLKLVIACSRDSVTTTPSISTIVWGRPCWTKLESHGLKRTSKE